MDIKFKRFLEGWIVLPQKINMHLNIIFEQGCLDKTSSWFEQNILIVAGVAIGIAVILVSICFHTNTLV